MANQKLWLSVRETAPLIGRNPGAIYEQIRTGAFPFAYRRGRGDRGAIYISARDLGLITANEETQEGAQSVTTKTPTYA